MGPPVARCQYSRPDFPEAPLSPYRFPCLGVAPWVSLDEETVLVGVWVASLGFEAVSLRVVLSP